MREKPLIAESKLWTALIRRFVDFSVIPVAAIFAGLTTARELTGNSHLGLTIAMSMVIALWLYPEIGLYQAWRGKSLSRELLSASQAWTLNFLLLGLISYITGNAQTDQVSYFAHWYIFGLGGLVGSRTSIRYLLNQLRARGHDKVHIIIIGDNGVANSTIRTLESAEWTGFNILGYFGRENIDGKTKLGSYDDVSRFLDSGAEKVDQIWIAMPLYREKEINAILQQLRFATQDIRLVPDIEGFRLINHSVTQVANLPVINLQTSPITGFNRFIKASEDRVLAFLVLLVLSPLMLAIAIAVKLSSPGPVFYRQERVSRANKPFMMYKFRSMPVDTEQHGVFWGGADGKTATPFGKFIRRTSLDELPQFINVLLGDMSIVGPRPERTEFVNEFKLNIDGYMQKHMVKAGITGLAQVNGWRGDTDLQKRIECDLHYINNWSVWLDLKIIALTFFKGFFHENAR